MDFGGNCRLLHYTMKRMYAPCLISAHRNRTNGQIEVWLVSDINEPVTGESCVHICMMYIHVLRGTLIRMHCYAMRRVYVTGHNSACCSGFIDYCMFSSTSSEIQEHLC